jgi:hypothetical protein
VDAAPARITGRPYPEQYKCDPAANTKRAVPRGDNRSNYFRHLENLVLVLLLHRNEKIYIIPMRMKHLDIRLLV